VKVKGSTRVLPFTYGTDSLNSSLKSSGKDSLWKSGPSGARQSADMRGALARVVLTAVRSHLKQPFSLSLVILSEVKDPIPVRTLSAVAGNSLRSLVYSPSPTPHPFS